MPGSDPSALVVVADGTDAATLVDRLGPRAEAVGAGAALARIERGAVGCLVTDGTARADGRPLPAAAAAAVPDLPIVLYTPRPLAALPDATADAADGYVRARPADADEPTAACAPGRTAGTVARLVAPRSAAAGGSGPEPDPEPGSAADAPTLATDAASDAAGVALTSRRLGDEWVALAVHPWGERELATTVASAVADHLGVGLETLPSLYESVETDGLASVLAPRGDGLADAVVRFRHAGLELALSGDGVIAARQPPARSANESTR
jgi:hypothetical protein